MTSTKTTQSLTPVFQFGAPNQSVLLAKDTVAIQINGNAYTGNGEVWLDLLPRANIHIYGNFQGVSLDIALNSIIGQKEVTSFVFGRKEIPGFLLNARENSTQQTMTLKWCPKSEPIVGIGNDSTIMQRLVFHLFNFKDIRGIANLEINDWLVELRPLNETHGNFEKLKAEGGYGLTHIGCLKKPKESSFSGKDAEEMLDALRFFLSFAKGIWCDPICAVGIDNSKTRVWESWSSPREPWHSPISWFDPHHCEQLAGLFPGFMKCWAEVNWRKALREVIYWYLNANYSPRGIDAGIILTQAATERLSYEYAVIDRRLVEAKGFKELRASDKFRLLFSSLDIPIDISSNVPEMGVLTRQFNWLDAPHAMTEVRNSLVHPEHRQRGQFDSALFEAWNLGLWYLELALLRICGYLGTYSNRMVSKWVGQIENVPWKKSAEH